MNVSVSRLRWSCVLCGVVAGLLLASTAAADSNLAGRHLLDLEIEWAGEKVVLKVPVGDVVLLSRQVGGEMVQFGLLAQPDHTVALAQVADSDDSQPRFLERLHLEPHRAIDAISTPMPVKVTLLGTHWRPDQPALGPDETLVPPGHPEISNQTASIFQKDRCCVTCGNVTACACAVKMNCGSCCSGVCCE